MKAANAYLLLLLVLWPARTAAELAPYTSVEVASPTLFDVPTTPTSTSSFVFAEKTLCQTMTLSGSTGCAKVTGLALGDVNGDSVPDIVNTHVFAPVAIWLGSVGGIFTAASATQPLLQERSHTGASGDYGDSGAYDLVLDDLDGDGDNDVFVSVVASQDVTLQHCVLSNACHACFPTNHSDFFAST